MAGTIWVRTRKGAFSLRSDASRRGGKLAGPQFLGHVIHHVVQDPREPRVLLMAATTGHLGPTVFRSTDRGRTWREAEQPPAFRKAGAGEPAKAVDIVFWLTAGHASERGTWYASTSPAGLFRSEDGGRTWQPAAGFNDHLPPDRLYQQNHCGIYRLDRPATRWIHSLAAHLGRRQAMCADARDDRLRLDFGTTAGEVWASANEGVSWRCIARHLSQIYSVTHAD